MYYEFETDPQTAQTDDERGESATEEWEPQRLFGRTAGESLRMGTGMTALTVHQFQQLLRSQARSAVLLQRLAATSAGMAFAAPTGQSRSRAAEHESAETSEDGEERDRDEPEPVGDTDEASEQAGDGDEPEQTSDGDEPEQAGNGNDQQGTPAVRRTPDGTLAFKQWQPQQLSVEPPEHDRLTAEKRRERAQSAASSHSETSEEETGRVERSEQDTGRSESNEKDADRAEETDEADDHPDPAAEML